jgi:hypothetical protein
MIKYFPIKSPAPWSDADRADLLSFDWQRQTAAFATSDDDRILEVSFLGCGVIVRMVDEFPLSTESDPEDWVGLVPHHFAYQVEGDPFFDSQSKAWRSVESAPKHYRFQTGFGCLDVISSAEPSFALVRR